MNSQRVKIVHFIRSAQIFWMLYPLIDLQIILNPGHYPKIKFYSKAFLQKIEIISIFWLVSATILGSLRVSLGKHHFKAAWFLPFLFHHVQLSCSTRIQKSLILKILNSKLSRFITLREFLLFSSIFGRNFVQKFLIAGWNE